MGSQSNCKSDSSLILFLCFAVFVLLPQIVRASAQNSESEELANDEDGDVSNYAPPLELQEKLPYFLSGFDKEGSPVWVFEFGKWDFRSLLEKGPAYEKLVEKYTEEMLRRFSESPAEFGADDYLMIVDLDGYDARQFTSALGLQQILTMARQFVRANVNGKGETRVKQVIGVNANYLFQTVYSLARPILGPLASVVELYGTNSGKWMPKLLKKIPKAQIPDWLGGSQNHRPIKIYG